MRKRTLIVPAVVLSWVGLILSKSLATTNYMWFISGGTQPTITPTRTITPTPTPTNTPTPILGKEVIIDNLDPAFSASPPPAWTTIGAYPTGNRGTYKTNYAQTPAGTSASATWSFPTDDPGLYDVYVRWTSGVTNIPDTTMSSNVQYTITYAGGATSTRNWTQQWMTGVWVYLGSFNFDTSSGQGVKVFSASDGKVTADAVDFRPTLPFTANPDPMGGQVRVSTNGRTFDYANGVSMPLVGINYPFVTNPPNTAGATDATFQTFVNAGINVVRSFGFNTQIQSGHVHDSTLPALAYDMGQAQLYENFFALGEKYHVWIQPQLSYGNAASSKDPYNINQGGPVDPSGLDPTFVTNELQCWPAVNSPATENGEAAMWKFYATNYGYTKSVFAWSIGNDFPDNGCGVKMLTNTDTSGGMPLGAEPTIHAVDPGLLVYYQIGGAHTFQPAEGYNNLSIAKMNLSATRTYGWGSSNSQVGIQPSPGVSVCFNPQTGKNDPLTGTCGGQHSGDSCHDNQSHVCPNDCTCIIDNPGNDAESFAKVNAGRIQILNGIPWNAGTPTPSCAPSCPPIPTIVGEGGFGPQYIPGFQDPLGTDVSTAGRDTDATWEKVTDYMMWSTLASGSAGVPWLWTVYNNPGFNISYVHFSCPPDDCKWEIMQNSYRFMSNILRTYVAPAMNGAYLPMTNTTNAPLNSTQIYGTWWGNTLIAWAEHEDGVNDSQRYEANPKVDVWTNTTLNFNLVVTNNISPGSYNVILFDDRTGDVISNTTISASGSTLTIPLSVKNSVGIVVTPAGSTPTPTPTNTPTPTPTSTPTPTGVYYYPGQYTTWNTGTSTNNCNTANLTDPDITGCVMPIKWAALEPRNGVFDWSAITAVENQLPAGKFLQLNIVTGEGGSPTSQGVCDSVNNQTEPPPSPTCQPWLFGITGVSSQWEKIGANGKGQQNIAACAPLLEPNPADASYQTAIKGFYAALQSHFAVDNKISYILLNPMSHYGSDFSMATVYQPGSPCASPSPSYHDQWATLSGCTTNNAAADTCFLNWVKSAVDSIWFGTGGAAVTIGAVQPLSVWTEEQQFPSMSTPGGINHQINPALFADILTHQPAAGFYVGQEAQSTGTAACNQMTNLSVGGIPPPSSGYVTQMVSNFQTSGVTDCTQLCNAGVPSAKGYPNGCASQEEPYAVNFPDCPASIHSIAQALGGDLTQNCPAATPTPPVSAPAACGQFDYLGGHAVPATAPTNANGMVFTVSWDDLEPGEGLGTACISATAPTTGGTLGTGCFDWSKIDNIIAADKTMTGGPLPISLFIGTTPADLPTVKNKANPSSSCNGNAQCAGWMDASTSPKVASIDFAWDLTFGAPSGQTLSAVLPGDPNYLLAWKGFWHAFRVKYRNNTTISSVIMMPYEHTQQELSVPIADNNGNLASSWLGAINAQQTALGHKTVGCELDSDGCNSSTVQSWESYMKAAYQPFWDSALSNVRVNASLGGPWNLELQNMWNPDQFANLFSPGNPDQQVSYDLGSIAAHDFVTNNLGFNYYGCGNDFLTVTSNFSSIANGECFFSDIPINQIHIIAQGKAFGSTHGNCTDVQNSIVQGPSGATVPPYWFQGYTGTGPFTTQTNPGVYFQNYDDYFNGVNACSGSVLSSIQSTLTARTCP